MQSHFLSIHTKSFALTFKRFSAVYFFLYSFPFPLADIPFLSVLNIWYFKITGKVVIWAGTRLCGVPADLLVHSDGSSDTTYNYIRLGLWFLSSLVFVAAWSLYKPLGKIMDKALPAMITYVRYYLAFTMLRYGADKIIKAQFPFPYHNLNETYGESSPLRLFKSFMGFSLLYNIFLGLSEATAALLLMFTRTKIFGALLSIIILINIVVLNFTFDLSVKMVSLILLLMSFFVLLTGRKLILDIYRHLSIKNVSRYTVPHRQKKVWSGLQLGILICIVYSISVYAWKLYRTSGDGAFARTSLFGIYNTILFVKNGDTLLPLLTDMNQWKALNIGNKQSASLKMMTDSMRYCRVVTDTIHKTICIDDKEDSAYKSQFSYSVQDTILVLTGRIKRDSVKIIMYKQDYNEYRLINRGFHWINEYPYAK